LALTARQNLQVALEIQGHDRRTLQARVDQALEEASLTHVAQVRGGSLSGGERRRLEMARALLLRPKVLLLDEPFAGVDPIAVASLQQSIRAVAKRGIGVLITDHNVQETLRLCDRAYLMAAGAILAAGRPESIVADAAVRKVYLGEHFRL
jgi:lipopolysaccharide export system ATP-binding protein